MLARNVVAQENAQPTQPAQANEPSRVTQPVPFPVIVVQGNTDAAHEKQREEQADAHDAADLLAQQQAASAAERSATATEGQLQPIWASVILSAIAALVSAGALVLGFLTQRSIDRTSRAELRAYVNVIDFSMEGHAPSVPTAVVTIKNTGQTPARKMHFRIGITTREPMELVRISEGVKSVADLGAGAPQNLSVEWIDFIGELQGAVLNHGTPAWVHGIVSYDDVFAQNHNTWFKLRVGSRRVDIGDKIRQDITMSVTADGNLST